MKKEVAVGQIFGRYEVISPQNSNREVQCRCLCGIVKWISKYDLLNGSVKSCGCLKAERIVQVRKPFKSGKDNPHFTHGKSSDLRYGAYNNILDRCYNPKHESYQNYGGRGISVCEKWLKGENGKTGFECFYEDVGPRLDPKLTINRIDNNGNYEPGNVRWASRKVQTQNQRKTFKTGCHQRAICIYCGYESNLITVYRDHNENCPHKP